MSSTATDKRPFRMVAKTLFGLEELLAPELAALGATSVKPQVRSVEFFGDQRLLYAANLWCRTATRILKPIAAFNAPDERTLYRQAGKVEWEKYLSLEQTFAIDAVVTESPFTNSLYLAQKVKDAIADRFRERTGQRPSVDVKNPDVGLSLYVHRTQCTLALDASGEALFKRGYRTATGKAPLNEVLAAGLVMKSEWDRQSSFVDGMCGSGTIVIEAAQLARNIAPGLTRKAFGFMHWPDYDAALFAAVREEARKQIRPSLDFAIVGSDRDRRQVQEAAANAAQAGVGDNIVFKQSELADLTPPAPPGTVIINPPYGERLSIDDARSFYHDIGDAFKKNFTGYDAFVFTGNLAAVKQLGLRASRRIHLFNGPIECRLLKYEMYQGSRKGKGQTPEEV